MQHCDPCTAIRPLNIGCTQQSTVPGMLCRVSDVREAVQKPSCWKVPGRGIHGVGRVSPQTRPSGWWRLHEVLLTVENDIHAYVVSTAYESTAVTHCGRRAKDRQTRPKFFVTVDRTRARVSQQKKIKARII